jgi:hypothetical protein
VRAIRQRDGLRPRSRAEVVAEHRAALDVLSQQTGIPLRKRTKATGPPKPKTAPAVKPAKRGRTPYQRGPKRAR